MTQPLNLTASIPGAAGGETDTSNNATTTTLQPTYVPTPDLIIAATSPSTTFTQGSSVVVTRTVTNQGDRATYGVNGPITVYIQLPPDCTVDTSALPSGWTVSSSSDTEVVLTTTSELAAFSSIDLVLTYTIIGNPEGLGFFAEVATQGDLRDDNNYSGWLNLTRA